MQRNSQNGSRRCFNCRRIGHLQRTCRSRARSINRESGNDTRNSPRSIFRSPSLSPIRNSDSSYASRRSQSPTPSRLFCNNQEVEHPREAVFIATQ
ncbi:unnamed protein product, partial [Psylliodes chrysocephalus]